MYFLPEGHLLLPPFYIPFTSRYRHAFHGITSVASLNYNANHNVNCTWQEVWAAVYISQESDTVGFGFGPLSIISLNYLPDMIASLIRVIAESIKSSLSIRQKILDRSPRESENLNLLDTGVRNRIGGNSFHTCRGGIRSQLLRIDNEKRKINQEQAGGSRRIKEHTSKCRSCLMHAIQLMPAENAHKTFLWSLDGYAGKTSNNNCDILKSMIQNIINHRGEILALWNNGQEDDVWDTVTSLMVFGR